MKQLHDEDQIIKDLDIEESFKEFDLSSQSTNTTTSSTMSSVMITFSKIASRVESAQTP